MENNKNLLYFVTGNRDKFNEILKSFQKENLNYNLKQLNLDTYEIQADTIKEVALFKLNSVKKKINNSFFVEDAGFFVDKPLNGFPGVFSSYVFKTIGNEGILKLINDFESTEAHFVAVIVLYFKALEKILLFVGNVKGKISKTMRGKGGFGFDPIFIPDIIQDKTFAELSIEEKNKISHRGKALKKLISFLKEN
ncbi:MAG: RdgB/HAM1 family non-canonical purine NTP pyrophosphatase [Promethearchaeota archaeon]